MDSETEKLKTSVGEMRKRRAKMEDGRRYIIYYTFGSNQQSGSEFNFEQLENPKAEIPNPKSESGVENV